MEYSADPRLTETELTELSELFVKIYENGAYDPEEGNKTPAQRKQVKHQFKKTLKTDLNKMSKYYMCVFRTVLECDISKMSLLRRRIKDIKREKEELIKNLDIKRQIMKDELRKEIRDELIENDFKDMEDQNKRLRKRLNEYNTRLQFANKQNQELQMESETWVSRKDHETLSEQYYQLLKKTSKNQMIEQTKEDKEREEKRKRLEQLQKEDDERNKEKAKLMAELECNNDEPEEIVISCLSDEE